jgi:hypothetical protein
MSYYIVYAMNESGPPEDGDLVASGAGWSAWTGWVLEKPEEHPYAAHLAENGWMEPAGAIDELEDELVDLLGGARGPLRGVTASLLEAVRLRPLGCLAILITDGTEPSGEELEEAAHDVSGEERDPGGRWTAGGSKGRAGVKKLLAAVRALPGHLIPERVKVAASKVRQAVVGRLVKRYGERTAGLILKAAALSAPVPVPGSQPLTIAVALVLAEAVRAYGKLRGATAVAESFEDDYDLSEEEIEAAARELLAEIEAALTEERGEGEGG